MRNTGRTATRVRAILSRLPAETRIILGVSGVAEHRDTLVKAGFTSDLAVGESVLPAPVFGRTSRFNAEGREIKHKDRPMETAYRQAVWRWKEFRGRHDYEWQSKIVDVPYKRYPRTLVSPPSVELRLAVTANDESVVVGPSLVYAGQDDPTLEHIIKLFLEIFGECSVFAENLDTLILPPVRRLNWEVLPAGRRPWSTLRGEVEPILEGAPEGNRKVIQYRFETLNGYDPEFAAIGQAGFKGYLVFGFPQKNLYVLESAYTGNATYVFNERWEDLSKRTKAEIIDENLHTARLVHRRGWRSRVRRLLDGEMP